jgi:hypothetical protein
MFLRVILPRVTLSEACGNAFVSRIRCFGAPPRHSYRIDGEHTWTRMQGLRHEYGALWQGICATQLRISTNLLR